VHLPVGGKRRVSESGPEKERDSKRENERQTKEGEKEL